MNHKVEIRFSEEDFQRLTEEAKRLGVPKTTVIRLALGDYYLKLKEKQNNE